MLQPVYPMDRNVKGARVTVLKEHELPEIMAIERRTYEFPWSEGIFKDCFRSGYAGLALRENEIMIGYGMISYAAGEAHLLNVAVAPEFQGQGHGKHLTKRLIDLARWHHADQIFLEARITNTRAQSLYASLGFCEIGERKNYYPGRMRREDAVVMALDLSLNFADAVKDGVRRL